MPAQLGSPRMRCKQSSSSPVPRVVFLSFHREARGQHHVDGWTLPQQPTMPANISPAGDISSVMHHPVQPSPVPELRKMSTGASCPSEPSHRPAAAGLPCRKISAASPPPYLHL